MMTYTWLQPSGGDFARTMFRRPASRRRSRFIATGLLFALAVTAVALMPKVVRADDQGAFQGTLTVQFTGSQQCAPDDSTCTQCVSQTGSFFVEAQGIAQTTLGPLFAKVLKCSNPNITKFGGYAGTLTLSATPPSVIAAPKDVLTLTYAGKNDDAGDFYGFGPFSGKLTVENGAGKFQGAQGTIAFIAAGGPSVAAAEFGATPNPFAFTGNAFYLLHGTISQGGSQ
jgi:hypothetical protein